MEQRLAREFHGLQVGGSSPSPATRYKLLVRKYSEQVDGALVSVRGSTRKLSKRKGTLRPVILVEVTGQGGRDKITNSQLRHKFTRPGSWASMFYFFSL